MTFSLREKCTGKFTGQLLDHNGASIPGTLLDSLTLSLFVLGNETTYVNNRNNQDVLNKNNVTVDSDGVLTWDIQVGDTAILGVGARETHRALFKWTWETSKAGNAEFDLVITNVKNLQ